jgi:hypothetical protein
VPASVSVPVDVTVTAMVEGGEQDKASVTVHVYVPGQRPVAVAAVPPEGAHEYVNGPTPPVVVTVALPVHPEQPLLVTLEVSVSALAHDKKSIKTPES